MFTVFIEGKQAQLPSWDGHADVPPFDPVDLKIAESGFCGECRLIACSSASEQREVRSLYAPGSSSGHGNRFRPTP